jgi:hypothetical protein
MREWPWYGKLKRRDFLKQKAAAEEEEEGEGKKPILLLGFPHFSFIPIFYL